MSGELSSGWMERQAPQAASPQMRKVAPYPNSPQTKEASQDG